MSNSVNFNQTGLEIAIIGMAGRFPGSKNLEEFWQNLRDGVESIVHFTDEELKSSEIDPAVLSNPNYVRAKGLLEDIELFDANFFGFNPREAEVINPQQRIFLECAWQAIENAGYDSKQYKGSIGVYAGTSINDYLINLYSNPSIKNHIDVQQLVFGNDKDFVTTRVSYKLDLEGPSIDVQTACSTSLVAVHLACRSLLGGECDIALAGGVAISSSQKTGYLYKEGGILSPDGHCRAFDAKAQGTVGGDGVGIVVLKRLEDALADGDCIHAVIKGSAINNDGALKVSYTAPRIDTQASVIRAAQTIAEVQPETITYVEAHGTGTSLGDPIEIAALTQAFYANAANSRKKNYCAIGSVKTNIGHLDITAGVAGLIKTVLALKNKQIPPSLNFEQPNPKIDFNNSPFYVNTTLSDWNTNSIPRRAGVSSFGIGGTNAHVILEEAPTIQASSLSRPWQLLFLSAKTESALETATTNLLTHLKQHHELNLADTAYTLQVGRRAFEYRRILLCKNLEDAVTVLENLDSQRTFTHFQEPCNRQIVFMFPGQGSQYVNMTRELYETELVFRKHVDECCEIVQSHLDVDLRTILYPNEGKTEVSTQQLLHTQITQPALFVIEYALAKLWMAWGVSPQMMIGHSIGEYVAATLAGVFCLEDALAIVATRGKLMQQCSSGAMLSIGLNEKEVQQLLDEEVSLAASNSPSSCVVSGSTQAIDQLQQKLQQTGVNCRRLHTNHAFHSPMMSPIIETFVQFLEKVKLNPPKIPLISNLSGTWMTTAQATDPNYWAQHLRQPVRFCQGITELLKTPETLFLEIGPGRTLSSFVKQHQKEESPVLTSLRHPQEQESDVAFLLKSLGKLWLFGVKVDWSGFYIHERRHRIPLPTYPFERKRYWIEVNKNATLAMMQQQSMDKKPDIADWFYVPRWKESTPLELFQKEKSLEQKLCWLVFVDTYGVGAEVAQRLKQQGQDVIVVGIANSFAKLNDYTYTINPQQRDDYDTLLQAIKQHNLKPQAIAHFWSITPNDILLTQEQDVQTQNQFFEDCQYLGFWSLLFLSQALGKIDINNSLKLMVVTSNLYDVTGGDKLCPQKATILGPCKVIPKEYSNINCCMIDTVIPSSKNPSFQQVLDYLITEFIVQQSSNIVAYRGDRRWIQSFKSMRLEQSMADKSRFRFKQRGVYLITGGLGGIGLVLAEHLAKSVQAKLVLVGRKIIPEKSNWQEWLESHDEQDTYSRIIRKIQVLETLGAEVLVISADVVNSEQMQSVITQSIEKFGQINGVIHAAGIAGGGIIQLKTQDMASKVLAPKVKGTVVLQQVFQNTNLDFLVLCSSQSSILGEFGQVDYCAANAFLDVYANKAYKSGLLTISINWDTWQEIGMAVETVIPDEIKHLREEELEEGIMPQEGVDAFNRILGSCLPHVIVSTKDLQALTEHHNSFRYLEEGLAFLEAKLAAKSFSKLNHPRPNLQNDYVAPRNEVEATIAEVWQNLLGIQQIGIYDNFFELGGDSLLATQLFSRLHQLLKVNFSMHSFFDTPTIIEQALIVNEKNQFSQENLNFNTIERIDRSNEQQNLTSIDEISDSEVELLLKNMLAGKGVVE